MQKDRVTKVLAHVIRDAGSEKSKSNKIKILQENKCPALLSILQCTYNPEVEWLLPSSPPHWEKNGLTDNEGILYKEYRKFRIFAKGGGYDNMDQTRREIVFIQFLEGIHDDDADMICHMLTKKPFKGLTKKTVAEAFPELGLE